MRIPAALLATLCACGEADTLAGVDPYKPYGDDAVTVLGTPDKPIATGAASADGCLQVTDTSCVPITREGTYCKESAGPTDVVLVNGQVQQVVCYGASDAPEAAVDGDHDGGLDVPQQHNGAVITIGTGTVKGSVTLDGNDVTLYGDGPDKSVIEGDLTIAGNNARVRGVRVKGSVHIELNTAAILLSVIEGDLILGANNALAAANDVFGRVSATGNNTILVSNDVAGAWQITGHNASCSDNHAFTDADMNGAVGDMERAAALSCP